MLHIRLCGTDSGVWPQEQADARPEQHRHMPYIGIKCVAASTKVPGRPGNLNPNPNSGARAPLPASQPKSTSASVVPCSLAHSLCSLWLSFLLHL